MKSLTNTYNWDVYHVSATTGGSGRLILNSSGALDTSNNPFGGVSPTTDLFTFNNAFYDDASDSVLCYCWADVPGYSKFGSFEGNGDSSGTNLTWNGPFVYTGFRPALVIIKSVDSENNWNVQDDVRMSYNGKTTVVQQWDNTSSESTIGSGYSRSYFADGFKITNSSYETNKPSETFLYAAWAKNPFGNLYGGQANAR